MARLLPMMLLLLFACRTDPPPAPPDVAPPETPPTPTPPTPPPRATTDSGGIVQPRTVTSEREASGEIRETHKRSDGSTAFEASYRGKRAVRIRAVAAAGHETWLCELADERGPRCVVRNERGDPLSTEALAARNYDARQRLNAARKLLAPPDHDDEHAGHEHDHFKMPAPSKEEEARWQAKRSKAWAEAEPWFERVDALQDLGLPTVVATLLAKEELSSGFWVVPTKKPLGPEDHDGHDH